MSNHSQIKNKVESYYTDKIKTHGTSPQGVDWNSEESQELRFDQLSKVIDSESDFSILDYGCGYGKYFEYLSKKFSDIHFTGLDLSEEMLKHAKILYPGKHTAWKAKLNTDESFDYVIASGIFNVRMEVSTPEWEDYIYSTLQEMNRVAKKGFSFNILTAYSDKEYMRDYLYYANPEDLFSYCKENFSKTVAILHDYPLYEFSVIVKKGLL